MAVVSPKTIVITTVSNKQALNKMTITPAMSDSLSDNGSNGGRKRKRLTHLTPEERMMRRKLKNRIAAQTARDRKKARMEELQDAIIALQEENDQLMKENQSLQQRSGVLAQENNKLKERLGAKVPVKQEAESESAALLAVPLQKERARVLVHGMTHYLSTLMTLSLMYSWDYFSKLQKQPALHQTLKTKQKRSHLLSRRSWNTLKWWASLKKDKNNNSQGSRMWWGPQQQSWNPSKN